jgi:hypothetical protein
MTVTDDKNLPKAAKRRLSEATIFVLQSVVRSLIGAAAITVFIALYALARSFSWSEVAIVVAAIVVAVAAITLLAIGLYNFFRLRPLAKWRELTSITDLTNFEKANKESPFMPIKIFQRDNIRDLSVMGNGCSKWTRKIDKDTAVAKFKKIRNANGSVRFLVSCPIHLSDNSDERMKKKAKWNAKSLTVLREFQSETRDERGKFEIRTYKHLATLRLIILNGEECIVGHYQEEGIGESLLTPLLIFWRNDQNQWGFGHAFRRLFESEWNRAAVPTADEWKTIEELSR